MNPKAFIEGVRNIFLEKAFPEVGEIVSFDAETQRAEVRLLTRNVLDDDTEENKHEIIDIPVYYPTFGPFSISASLSEGDEVLVIFTGRDIDVFKQNGGMNTPKDARILHHTDGLAIPWNISAPKKVAKFTNSFWMGKSDRTAGIEITPSSTIAIGNSSVELVASVTKLAEEVSKLSNALASATIITSTGTGKIDPGTLATAVNISATVSALKSLLDGLKI